jgi:SAM-dependent methyltransferase
LDVFDEALAQALSSFFLSENAVSVADFGCGTARYAATFIDQGLACDAFDGNPDTPALTNGLGQVLDLAVPVDLGKQYDWVLSLEVGEHIPKEYEAEFIANLDRHARKGVILSWAVKGQGGHGHVNNQDNDYLKAIFEDYGYINDLVAEEALRDASTTPWFPNTLMVFRKP